MVGTCDFIRHSLNEGRRRPCHDCEDRAPVRPHTNVSSRLRRAPLLVLLSRPWRELHQNDMPFHGVFVRRRPGKAQGHGPAPSTGPVAATVEHSAPVTVVSPPRPSSTPRGARVPWRRWSCSRGPWRRGWTPLRVCAAIVVAATLVAWAPSRSARRDPAVPEAASVRLFLDFILARLQPPPIDSRKTPKRERVYIPVVERTRRHKVNATSRFLDELLSRQREPQGRPPASRTPEVRSLLTSITLRPSRGPAAPGPVASKLLRQRCRPGWFCRRCLASQAWGSFRACDRVCASCYADALCGNGGGTPAERSMPLGTVALRLQWEPRAVPATRYIPRIIHQEFPEPILSWQYPQLERIQNSWRASGWQYRFYTPNMARTYIQEHYPAVVLRAYDALTGPDRQSDLFRLLVLLREGGVYANIDLLLESSLEALLAPAIGFAAAREDSVDGSRDHCLWNGLVASQPGHPFLVRAVERAVTGILNHWTEDDLESTICASMDAPLWKTREAPATDNIFGSCALGFAVQQVLGQDVLGEFRLSTTHQIAHGIGESLVLMMSLHDTGAYRCSDVQQNILIASTGQSGLTKAPIQGQGSSRRSWLRLRCR